MRSLDRALTDRGSQGRRLRLPWPSLNRQVTLRTQELVLVIGAPGGGKSTLALNMAMGMPGEWTLYLAQDTPHSAVTGLAAIATGLKKADVQSAPVDPKVLREKAPRLIVEEGSQSVGDITDRLDALTEWIGHCPSLMFVDNLIDLRVAGQSYQDPSFYATVLPELKQLAIQRDMAIVLLHHVTKGERHSDGEGSRRVDKESGTVRLTLGDSLHAGGRDARHVWGVYHTETHLAVQVLKQNDGPADASGSIQAWLNWKPEHGKLDDIMRGDW